MTMTPETLKALHASIAHWEENLLASHPNQVATGPAYCALCKLFLNPVRHYEEYCIGCPVFEKTGLVGCRGTPHVEAETCADEQDMEGFRRAAEEEVAFLRSLLPNPSGEEG